MLFPNNTHHIFLHYILSLDRHAARHRIQLDFNGTTHRSEFVFSLFQVKVLQSGLSKARWPCRSLEVVCGFYLTILTILHLFGIFRGLPHLAWTRAVTVALTTFLTVETDCWNLTKLDKIFVFRSLKSCFEAPMSPLFTGESKSKTTCNWPP